MGKHWSSVSTSQRRLFDCCPRIPFSSWFGRVRADFLQKATEVRGIGFETWGCGFEVRVPLGWPLLSAVVAEVCAVDIASADLVN